MKEAQGLYDPRNEHDACGVGFLANINGEPSHMIVERGIEILKNLLHRGATGADPNTGDGAGLLIQVPDRFLRKECDALEITLPELGAYGVGMFFMPPDKVRASRCSEIIEAVSATEGFDFQGWRDVPVNGTVLGSVARRDQP